MLILNKFTVITVSTNLKPSWITASQPIKLNPSQVLEHIGKMALSSIILGLFPPCVHAEITTFLLSFALQHAVRVHNSAPRKGQTLLPYALFTGEDAPQ